jgi:uncharacterized protein
MTTSSNHPARPSTTTKFLAALIAAAGLNFMTATGGHAQDFDCATARNATERAICDSRSLKRADEKMARTYGRLWSAMSSRNFADSAFVRLRDEQREFLRDRDSCGGSSRCIGHAYDGRIEELRRQIWMVRTAKG